MIRRCSRLGPRTFHGPNTTHYCAECEEIQCNGYIIERVAALGPVTIFLCDDCLAKAKRNGTHNAKNKGEQQ